MTNKEVQVWRADCLLIDTDYFQDNMIDLMSAETQRYFLAMTEEVQVYFESIALIETNKIISRMIENKK